MSAHDEQQAKILEDLSKRWWSSIDAVDKAALEAGAAALRRASPETGWRAISAAPKDGTQVLIWIADEALDVGGYAIQAEYVAFDGPPPAEYRDGWCNGWDGAYINDDKEITHWHRLPAPPEVPHA